MLHFLHRIREKLAPRIGDTENRIVQDALDTNARHLRAIDPATEEQWRRLQIALEREPTVQSGHRSLKRRSVLRPAISFAFAAIVLFAVGVFWLRQFSARIYETAKGEHSSITLQDSTEVSLNAMSELTVHHSLLDNTRRVTLKGEGLFHVRRNGTPFILTSDVGTVQVLGTIFNVRVRDGRMEVAVLDGTVRVSAQQNEKDSSIILTRGQFALCKSNGFPEVPTGLPFPDYPGWIHGKFMFYRSDLLTACKEVESQFNVVIKIERPQLLDFTLTGIINGQSAETALATLVQLTGNKFRYEEGCYIIY